VQRNSRDIDKGLIGAISQTGEEKNKGGWMGKQATTE